MFSNYLLDLGQPYYSGFLYHLSWDIFSVDVMVVVNAIWKDAACSRYFVIPRSVHYHMLTSFIHEVIQGNE